MNENVMHLLNPFVDNLSKKVDKGIFVGTVIQILGICKMNHCTSQEVLEIFQYILYEAEFDERQNHDYLITFINQISNRRKESFDIEAFEKSMFRLIQQSPVTAKQQSIKTTGMDYYEAIARADEAEYAEKEVRSADTIKYEETQFFEAYENEENAEDTGILDESFWNNTNAITMAEHLQAGYGEKPSVSNMSFLIKESTGEKISVIGDVFSIGKDSTLVDYAITGNTTVSRKHAEIIKRGRHFFLCDKGSTNKTYVEGKEIRPEEFVEIHNGTKFKISNEEFTFHA